MTRLSLLLLALSVALAAVAPPSAHSQTTPPLAQPAAPPSPEAPPTSPPAEQPTIRDDKDSIEAAMKWLALLDAGKAGAAWDVASKQLQSKVTRNKFIAEMRDVRKPLGKLASRTAVKFARAHDLPGAPTGDYTLIEFEAKYANGKKLAEQVVWVIEAGDIWRIAGYFYR